MKQTINVSDFRDAFHKMGRGEQFSYDGLGSLFDWLEDWDEEPELDVIAFCCEFSEYKNLAEFQHDYNADDYPDIDSIENETIVIPIDDDRFIVQQF